VLAETTVSGNNSISKIKIYARQTLLETDVYKMVKP